jgi:hypothetical protein
VRSHELVYWYQAKTTVPRRTKMQQATTIRSRRQVGLRIGWGALALLVVVLGTVVAGWAVSRSQIPASPLPRSADHQPQSRRFADEAAYVPAASDYASAALGEDYLPLPTNNSAPSHVAAAPAPVVNRLFADEAAYVPMASDYASAALGEDYLPLAAAVSTTSAQARPVLSLRFTDEAAYRPTPQEYSTPALGDDYLPLARTAPSIDTHYRTPSVNRRILSDELAGAAQILYSVEAGTLATQSATPIYGPR